MSDYKCKVSVKQGSTYPVLNIKNSSIVSDFDNSGTTMTSTNTQDGIKELWNEYLEYGAVSQSDVSSEFINNTLTTIPKAEGVDSFYYGASVVYNNEIHILGGDTTPWQHLKFNGTSWVSVSTLPTYRDSEYMPLGYYGQPLISAVVYNNEIHIFGSVNGIITHYSWNGSIWTQRSVSSSIPSSTGIIRAIVHNNNIYLSTTYEIIGEFFYSAGFKLYIIATNGDTITEIGDVTNSNINVSSLCLSSRSDNIKNEIYIMINLQNGYLSIYKYVDNNISNVLSYNTSGEVSSVVYLHKVFLFSQKNSYIFDYINGAYSLYESQVYTNNNNGCSCVYYNRAMHLLGGIVSESSTDTPNNNSEIYLEYTIEASPTEKKIIIDGTYIGES